MAKQYYSVLTTYGAQLFAQAMANKRPVTITHMAVGDGNGKSIQPDSTRTTLFREVHRTTVSAVSTDPRNNKQVIFELTIPEAVGGFYIREMGIFDATGKMVAMANCPETYKPRLDEGSGKVQVLRMVLLVSSSDAVTITVDDSVIFATRGQLTPKTLTGTSTNAVNETGHTHEIAKASITQAGLVQLTNDTGLDSEVLALTAKAGKDLSEKIDNIKVGGRNLLLNSAVAYAGNGYSTRYELTEAPALGEDVVITLWGEIGVDRTGIGVFNTQDFSEIANLRKIAEGVYQGKGKWRHPQNGTQDLTPNNTHLNIYFYPRTATSSNTINKIKLERGTIGSDWSAAPEDKVSMVGNETITGVKTFKQSLEMNYRAVIRRNSGLPYNPYMLMIDDAINLANDLPSAKSIGDISFAVTETGQNDGRLKGRIRAGVDQTKQGYLEIWTYDAANTAKIGVKTFGSGNVAIGKTTDNGNAKLQISGTAEATSPAKEANNNLLVTSAWARTNTANLVDARTAYLGGSVAIQDCNPGQLPQGAFFGVASKNLANSEQNGFVFASKPWYDNSGHFASVRFGIFGNKFFYQSAKNETEWHTPLELATVPYVDGRFTQLIGAAPAALDTLQELAQALKSNANVLDLYQLKTDKSDAVNLNDSNKYASAKAVKTAYDKGVNADNNANNRVLKSGDTMTGHLLIKSGDYSSLRTYNSASESVRWESAPTSTSNMAAIVLAGADDVVKYRFLIPSKNGTAAIDADVVHLSGDEVITGEKTLHYQIKLRSNADNSKLGRIGQSANDFFIQNGYSGKFLQLKNTGELRYNNNLVHDESMPYVKVAATDGAYAGIDISRSGTSGTWVSRIEALPDKRWKFYVQNAHEIYMPAKGGTVVLDSTLPIQATRWPAWSEVTNKPTLVQDIRLGATVRRKLGDAEWQTHGAGYVVTGFYNVSEALRADDNIYVKPIQKYINGAWVTIANA